MFCPHCGADKQKPEAYCTRCGVWLSDPNAGIRHGRRIPHTAQSPEQKLRSVLAFNVIDALIALFSFVVLLVYMHSNTHWSASVTMALSLVIAVHQMVSFKFNLDLRRRLKRGRESAQAELTAPLAAPVERRALDAGDSTQFVAPFGVTENTTELLEQAPRGRGERR